MLNGVLLSELGTEEIDAPGEKSSLVIASVIFTPGGDGVIDDAPAGTMNANEIGPTTRAAAEPDEAAAGTEDTPAGCENPLAGLYALFEGDHMHQQVTSAVTKSRVVALGVKTSGHTAPTAANPVEGPILQ